MLFHIIYNETTRLKQKNYEFNTQKMSLFNVRVAYFY